MTYQEILKQYWGYDSFRDLQEDIITSIGNGKDTLGLMPTGGGKSITFQVPALAKEGLCIVITPLIALMKDQVQNLKKRGIKAIAIYSGMTRQEIVVALENCIFGDYKFLYISPERLDTEIFRAKLRSMKISMITVDESHCISQWGYDFRPAYLKIADIRDLVPDAPVLALTATATPEVVKDIQERLRFQEENVFRMSFERKNLAYIVRPTDNKNGELLHILNRIQGSAIVYVRSRRKTKETTELLVNEGITADFYHAGLDNATKDLRQKRWQNGESRVMVATNAFGMGIDKSNVRYVIHHNMPESIEAYYQEAGRAGRDGEPSRCTLLWNESDIVTRRRLLDMDNDNERLTPEERETVRMSKRRLLDGMIGYCRTTDCLHVYMTRYFGENTPRTGTCTGGCTNCDSTFETLDVTDIARSISRCVHDAMYDYDDQGRPTCGPVRQGLGSGKIVAILRGSKAKDLIARHLDRCPSYGRLHDAPEARIRDVLSQMATDGFLSIAEGRLPIVGFGQRAAETVAPEFRYEIKRVERKAAGAGTGMTSRTDSSSKSAASDGPALGSYAPDDENETLFQKLRELRLSIARENSLPPYMVFNDRTLRDMARLRPITDAQFLAINGVGDSKLAKYGKRFMEAIAGFDD